MKLYKNQKQIFKKIKAGFKKHNKGVLCACCGSGKTFIALSFIKELIDSGKRVAISTYSRTEIRMQWIKAILESNIIDPHLIQFVCKIQDVKDLQKQGIPAISNSNISKTKPVTIFIPQSVGKEDFGKFDYFIIDEAHEYFDIEGGLLKRIIKKHSNKNTKILGLTGTGFELVKGFFSDGFNVIYDMPAALKDKVICDCEIIGEYFDINLAQESYSGMDLNAKGRKTVKAKASHSLKLEQVLRKTKGKTLIVSPPGFGIAESINSFVNMKFGNCCTIKNMRVNDANKNELEFRYNKNMRFMVVVAMCGTGWDFPALSNVVDLTFTKNPKVIIQRFSRAIRKSGNSKLARYYYCCDSSKSENIVRFYLGRSLELTTEKGIMLYDGKVNFRKNYKRKSKIKRFVFGKVSEYYSLEKLTTQGKTIFRKNLSEMNGGLSQWDPMLSVLKLAQENGKYISEAIFKMDKKNIKFLECLKITRKEYPNEWKKIHGSKRPKDFEGWSLD